jgi:hypothetical protein
MTGTALREALVRRRRRSVRGRGHVRHHQPRRRRGPGGIAEVTASTGSGSTSTARTAGCPRRPLCATCSPASSTPTASSSTREVAVRPVRLLRAGLPRPGWHAARTPSTPATSTRSTTAVEPVRLRSAPVPPRPRAAILVLAGHARQRQLPRRDRVDAAGGTARRRRDPQPPVPGAAGGARPNRAHLQAGRVDGRGLRRLDAAAARPGIRVRHPNDAPGRALHAVRDHQPAHHGVRPDRHPATMSQDTPLYTAR